MKRKSNRPPRSGAGGFPTNALPPVLISLYHPPLHSSDEWEAAGRPFWCVKYRAARTCDATRSLADMYSRTLTPTFCPVAMVATLPMYSVGVYVGACGRWEPAEWTERRDYRSALRAVKVWAKLNPVQQVVCDTALTADTVQQYATNGDIRRAWDASMGRAARSVKASFDEHVDRYPLSRDGHDPDYRDGGWQA